MSPMPRERVRRRVDRGRGRSQHVAGGRPPVKRKVERGLPSGSGMPTQTSYRGAGGGLDRSASSAPQQRSPAASCSRAVVKLASAQWHRSGTSSRTSSGCGARWTSCSATCSIAARAARRGGFSPAVDVYYADRSAAGGRARRPRRASTPTRSQLEVRGRELVLSGHREPEAPSDDRVYQQLEIEHGPFRRVVALGAEVDADAADATYEDGILTVELPLEPPARPRTVPIRGIGPVSDRRRRAPARRCPDAAAGPAAARHRHLPGHADAAGGRPGALDPARQRRAGRRPHAGDARLQGPGPRDARPRRAAHRRRRRRRRAHAQGPRREPADPRPGAASGCRSRSGSARSPTSSRASPSCPTRSRRARS